MKTYFRLFAVVCLFTFVADTTYGQNPPPLTDDDGIVIIDFTEDFENGSANFSDSERNLVQVIGVGGVDGSAFIRAATDPDFQGVVFRAELDGRAPGPASDGAFAGDYLASEVQSFSFYVRHDATEDATFSVRFATSANFPAINFDLGTVAPSSDFTELTVDFTDLSAFGLEGFPGVTKEAVAEIIGNIQITTQSADTASYNVDVDNVSICVAEAVLLGDVNLDGVVNFLDIAPFILILSGGGFQAEADMDLSTEVDFLDIAPFIEILIGS